VQSWAQLFVVFVSHMPHSSTTLSPFGTLAQSAQLELSPLQS
jgi:hypothetical protein